VFISGGLVLASQNRMTQEVGAEAVGLVVSVIACLIGLEWGLAGVAWALVGSAVFYTVYIYVLVHRTIPIRVVDLFRAMIPALLLNSLLAAALFAAHSGLATLGTVHPVLYLAAMVATGGIVYGAAFLYLPIPALQTEVGRWRERFGSIVRLLMKPFR
jgi:O-antigen/teichoic acid export membrane protein